MAAATPTPTGTLTGDHPTSSPSRPIGRVLAGSLATGILAALLLVAAPFVPAEDTAVTGAVLCGFALGWAMLAVLSVQFTDSLSDGPRLLPCSWVWVVSCC